MPFYKWAVDNSAQTFSQRTHFEQSIQGRQNPPSKYGLYTNEKNSAHQLRWKERLCPPKKCVG